MRTIKELLQLMLDNQQLFYAGLCGWMGELYDAEIVNWNEYRLIYDYIQNNRPSKWSSFKAFNNRHSHYYWPIGDIKPRIKWLKHHIKKNS